ncbi:MAG: LLM class flavin-dependent oxidoreductase, partial [Pseudomonadota bacterium]
LRSREYVGLLKELWASNAPLYKGKTVGIEGFRMMPKPVQKPHPPFVFGGHTEPSLKRAARLGDGWYGIAESLADIRGVISRLRAHEAALGRATPLELTVSPRLGGPVTIAQVRELGQMGVSRIILGTTPTTREQLAEMERLRDEVMAKV